MSTYDAVRGWCVKDATLDGTLQVFRGVAPCSSQADDAGCRALRRKDISKGDSCIQDVEEGNFCEWRTTWKTHSTNSFLSKSTLQLDF